MFEGVPKMKIIAFKDPRLRESDKVGEPFVVQLNPEKYDRQFEIKYSEKQVPGTAGKTLKFKKVEPQTMEFEFLFDHTGAVGGETPGDLGVDEDINKLKEVALLYDGNIHRTRYLKLSWGNLLFKCCLERLQISYKLFKADGTPLRATVKASFKEFAENELLVKKQNDNSPDLTHRREVKDGETLPLMAHEIYGDSKYYVEVARVNGITNFRKLEVGQKIYFPPIEK